MKGMNVRLLNLALVLSILALACPVLAQTSTPPTPIWPTYHYDMYRGGQNKDSTDIKDPSTIKAIWAFPRTDDKTDLVDESLLVVDDSDTGFSATGRWRIQDAANDAVGNSFHYTDAVAPDPTKPNATYAEAYWPFPSGIPQGRYQVFIWVPNHPKASPHAKYSVTDDYGTRTFTFNQSINADTWQPLTNTFFTFSGAMANEGVYVTAKDENLVNGTKVLADAVKFVPVPMREIYSSPVTANIPVTLTDSSGTVIWNPTDDGLAMCVYVGALETGSLQAAGTGHNTGAIYCIYGITPTTQNPEDPANPGKPNPAVPGSDRLMKIAEYLGKPKWRYPQTGAQVNNRKNVEGPIQDGVFSSPTLATIAGVSGGDNKLVCFATGMDRQLYALDAVTGELLWKGPGYTVGEEDDSNVVTNWTRTDTREDAFGGKFHYAPCVADVASAANACTWNFLPNDQQNAAPSGADGLSYSIYAWIPEDGGTGTLRRSRNATYVIHYNDANGDAQEANITVDQSDSEFFGTWIKIGSSYFNPSKVQLLNTATPDPNPDPNEPPPPGSSAADYAVIADALMFVPDTIEGMGYSTPITDADTVANPTNALATRVFTVTETGRALSFDVQTPGNHVGHLNWVYPAIRTKAKPSADEMDQPGLGEMGASPAYSSDKLYIAGMNGVITCLSNVKSNTPVEDWKYVSEADVDGEPGGFTSSPALDGTNLYIASSAGHVYCLKMDGQKKDEDGNVVPVWEYPSNANDPPDNPLGAFRYSTPVVAVCQNIKRVWVASSDGHIYSFLADSGQRLYTDDNGDRHPDNSFMYDEPSFGLPVQGSIAMDGSSASNQNLIMYVGDMGDRSGTLHWRDAHTGRVPIDGTGMPGEYEGWTAPGVMFSSPNLTHLDVNSTKVTVILVGCGDGHLIAFTRKGGAWGGEWQGGEWPFEGDEITQSAQRSKSAPNTDIQFDVFTEQFFNDSLNLDPEPSITTFDPANWPNKSGGIQDAIVSLRMKVPDDSVLPTDIDTYLTKEAKARRVSTVGVLAPSRLTSATTGVASDTVFYEWGERIYAIVWNLPESSFLSGSSISDKVKPRMTNQSVGQSAGATSGGQTGNVNGLVMQVRALKDYTCLKLDSKTNNYTQLTDANSDIVRRSYALISIDIDGSRDRPPGPGPGWTLFIDIDKITSKSGTGVPGAVIRETIPLAKLKNAASGGGYEVVLINEQIREAPLGINNPLAIRDDGVTNDIGDGNMKIAWPQGINPDRKDNQAHLNGNYAWVSNTSSSSSTQPYNFQRLKNPLIYLGHVVHGTSSREAPLGVMDRSAMGVHSRKIPRFRIEDRDLMFRGGEAAIEASYQAKDPFSKTMPPVKGGVKFPWDQGIGSIDYPNIYSRYQTYQLISTNIDPATKYSELMPVQPPNSNPTHEASLVKPDTLLCSVDVPRFQPANESMDVVDYPGGYSRTMIGFVDSNNNGDLDSGNTNRGRPTTWQEAYRSFRVALKVPPDPKLVVDEQLIDIGRAPHGLGQNMTGPLTFTAFNKNPLIQQWFKPITIKNAGNVNLYNIRLDKALGLLGDQASPSQQLPGFAITSSLDVAPPKDILFEDFGQPPFNYPMYTWNQKEWYLGYTLSKPRVGDVDPTVMTIPDRRKWENDFASKERAAELMGFAGWDTTKPLPVLVSVQVPLTQPVGTYQSWDDKYRMPYVSVFSDVGNRTATANAGPVYGSDPMAVPSFQLKLGVRENQLTGGVTATTLPQIDLMTSGGFFARYGDSTPAAYRDANNDVRLFYSSNRLDPGVDPPTADADLARFASAPWFIHEARLRYRAPAGTNQATWMPASAQQWWYPAEWMPSDQWALNNGLMPSDLMKFDDTSDPPLYAVRHFAPSIGENLALAAAAPKNRTWLAWAGNGECKNSDNTVRQDSLIFYTDITPDPNASSTDAPHVFAIEHDPTQLKRAPAIVPDGNRMWMFWQGGTAGNWSIYYSENTGGPDFDTTKSAWKPDQKLRTPDCLAAAGSPNPILRRYGANLRAATGSGSGDFTDPFRAEYDSAYKAFDVVYAGTNKITRNADIFLSRYDAYGKPSDAPSKTGQTFARVYNERLARDPKLGFFTSRHIAWVRLRPGANPQFDDWGNYNGLNLPYVHVVFPKAYTDGATTLAPGSVLSATDGSLTVAGAVSEPPVRLTPEIDAASGVYTYSYPPGTTADKILGKMVVDYSSGIVTFSRPFRETAAVVNGVNTFSAPEVYADYTPQALRITTDSAVDGSPRAFIERTSMTDKNAGAITPGLDPSWGGGKPAPVDRLWIFWRKTGAGIENSTIFYTTMRIGIDLTKLKLPNGNPLPPIAMDPLKGTFATGADMPNVQIPNALGPWEVDRTGTKIYLSEVDERYKSANFTGPDPLGLDLQYDYRDKGGNQQHVSIRVPDVTWITELPEQSLGFTMDANVNEGSIYAFADPQPQLSGTSVGVRSSKIWVFWTSTRGGNSDLFWETLSPNFWGR